MQHLALASTIDNWTNTILYFLYHKSIIDSYIAFKSADTSKSHVANGC